MAGVPMAADGLVEIAAARPEPAALRPLVRQRQLAGDRHQRPGVLVGTRQRDRVEQAARVGVAHLVEHLGHGPGLDRLARIHHRDPVAGLEDQAEIVRDVDHRGAEPAGDLLDQRHDPGLDGDVERRGRLVQDQERGVGEQRHGDHHALLLAARDLVRVGVHDPLRVGQLDRGQHLGRPLARLRLGHLLVVERHLHQLLADQQRRVQRRHRLLVDHGDLGAAQLAQLLLAHRGHVAALELQASRLTIRPFLPR